ncbi:DUF7146 domain-containing protein [Pseudooceanicola algae]|uniref:Uncharacterized protein n=1 Tax=Pseudooceanicola algae TaxID=1537215 RepID=A0A418SK88_9RHOB|nr:toprim domain-containing protein [Pseudooceanicola algae]QPM89141.1 hypothetical protein PSAL_003520 [Pseudooceanicola algae]
MSAAMRQTYSLDEIKHMLIARLEDVVARYAPPAHGSYRAHGKFFTLNPGRADRHVGSFCVTMQGASRGRWNDYAVGDVPGQGFGDVLDLIALSLGCSTTDAIREARGFLGLQTASAEDVARHRAAAERSRRLQAEAAAKEKAARANRAKAARAIWHSGQARLRDTPVDHYLRGRSIDLSRLGRQPGVLRYVPDCRYQHMDRESGEIIEGRHPAMVAAVTDRQGRTVACHRTYLGIGPDGWGKAAVPQAKKVLGDYAGAYVPLWKGMGPRGGKPPALHEAEPGQHVFIAEGIEDALSAVLLLDGLPRVIAAISLSNLGQVALPPTVSRVTLIADQDEGEQARAALDLAIAQHRRAGREVRLWRNEWGGKDLNDALRMLKAKEEGS